MLFWIILLEFFRVGYTILLSTFFVVAQQRLDYLTILIFVCQALFSSFSNFFYFLVCYFFCNIRYVIILISFCQAFFNSFFLFVCFRYPSSFLRKMKYHLLSQINEFKFIQSHTIIISQHFSEINLYNLQIFFYIVFILFLLCLYCFKRHSVL